MPHARMPRPALLLVHSACASVETSLMPSLMQITSAFSNRDPSNSSSAFPTHGPKAVPPLKKKLAQAITSPGVASLFGNRSGRKSSWPEKWITAKSRFCSRAIESSHWFGRFACRSHLTENYPELREIVRTSTEYQSTSLPPVDHTKI